MVTLGILGLGLAVAILFAFLSLARSWSLPVAFLRLSWIPPAALVLQGIFFTPLAERMSYAVMALPLLTCFASLILGFVGVTLVTSARERKEPYATLLRATVLASSPVLLLGVYVLYAFVTGAA